MSTTVPKPLTISISKEAAEHVSQFTAQAGKPDANLRVGVKGGGCSGLTYVLDIVDGPRRRRQGHSGPRVGALHRPQVLHLPGRNHPGVLRWPERERLRVQQPQRQDHLRLRHLL